MFASYQRACNARPYDLQGKKGFPPLRERFIIANNKIVWYNSVIMIFGERLKELRTERKISQMELANATGISQSAIAKWELGRTEPSASALIKLSAYFSESVDYLLGVEHN